MTTVLAIPTTIDPILEDSEDESQPLALMAKDDETRSEAARRHSRSWFDSNLGSKKPPADKERERSKKHRSTTTNNNTTTSKQHSKEKSKSTAASGRKHHGDAHNASGHRRRRHSTSSTSSDEDAQPHNNHQLVLATSRARLTSPSMVSQFTTRTNNTNKSSGSSGSNSTVTQASITKHNTALVIRPQPEDMPMSPAVPDAPDVFAYLEAESVLDVAIHSDSESESEEEAQRPEQEEEDESSEEEEEESHSASWSRSHAQHALTQKSLPPRLSQDRGSSSSSASSSFHGEDDFTSLPHDVDTDRSTSPELNDKGNDSDHEHPALDPVSVKIASQMAAAQQRQNLHQLASPTSQRLTTSVPPTPTSLLTPRFPTFQSKSQPLSPGHLPVTGYELLATRLSTRSPDSDDGRVIKPMYRKFEALNHRVLLHLQDELSELEEHLQRLDQADTQARRSDRSIIPASRRQAAQAGGELQWHKTDVLGKIGYKLTQYNQALSSFNTTQALSPPDPEDISTYRDYLQTEHPIAEAETHFLDPTDDLVSVYSDNLNHRHPRSTQTPSYAPSTFSVDERPSIPSSTFQSSSSTSLELGINPNNLPGIASALAISVLVPILTFSVIDKFLGRLVVTLLVAIGMLGGLMQGNIINRAALFAHEAITCAAIYGGVMIVMAGIL